MDAQRTAREATAVLATARRERGDVQRFRSLLGQVAAYPRKDAADIIDALAGSLSEEEAKAFLRIALRQFACV